jgi:hypothetical protein
MLLKSLLFIVGLMAVDALALPVKRQQATKLGGVNLAVCLSPLQILSLIIADI